MTKVVLTTDSKNNEGVGVNWVSVKMALVKIASLQTSDKQASAFELKQEGSLRLGRRRQLANCREGECELISDKACLKALQSTRAWNP